MSKDSISLPPLAGLPNPTPTAKIFVKSPVSLIFMPAQKKLNKNRKEVDKKKTIRSRKIEPERDLFKWVAPARPFKRRDREFWITVIAIAAIAALILFAIEGVMPVMLIVSLIFLFYILTTVEPDNIEYRVTNYGIKIAEKRTDWELVRRFWFSRRFDSDLVIFETFVLPGRLELVINIKDKEKIIKVLTDYVIEEETPPSYLDKTANWFTKKLPGNK